MFKSARQRIKAFIRILVVIGQQFSVWFVFSPLLMFLTWTHGGCVFKGAQEVCQPVRSCREIAFRQRHAGTFHARRDAWGTLDDNKIIKRKLHINTLIRLLNDRKGVPKGKRLEATGLENSPNQQDCRNCTWSFYLTLLEGNNPISQKMCNYSFKRYNVDRNWNICIT